MNAAEIRQFKPMIDPNAASLSLSKGDESGLTGKRFSAENVLTMENLNSRDATSGAFQLDPTLYRPNVLSTEKIY